MKKPTCTASKFRFLCLFPFFFCLSASWTALAKEPQPLKVFVLAGQSNMQGHAHIRTFDAMRLNPQAAPLLEKMVDESGSPVVMENVWISSIGSSEKEKTGRLTAGFGAEARGPKIGPEFTFGITMHEHLDEPILIIKTAWGGKSLHTDFRPPSAEPYQFSEQQLETFQRKDIDIAKAKQEKQQATGHYYRLMIDHVRSVLKNIEQVYPEYEDSQGYELAGFVWFQGWNDMVDGGTYPNRNSPGGYDQYSKLLTQFIRDVRKDLSAPKLPFVIGVMGVGGPTDEYGPEQARYKDVHQNFRDAMAAPASRPEFQDNVATVLTEKFWDQQVVELRKKEAELKPQIQAIEAQMKAGKLDREEGQQAIDALYADAFSERELTILKESTSNFDFHYMGSGGIVGQIGQAFADAMIELIE